jgi:hypothetical protein
MVLLQDTSGGGDSLPSVGMTTPVGKHVEAATDVEVTGVGKGKKLGIKRVKKKPDMNISKGKLKSVTTPKNFSCMLFHFNCTQIKLLILFVS